MCMILCMRHHRSLRRKCSLSDILCRRPMLLTSICLQSRGCICRPPLHRSSYRIHSRGMSWHPRVVQTCHQCTHCKSSP
jgi:hypothetical protein